MCLGAAWLAVGVVVLVCHLRTAAIDRSDDAKPSPLALFRSLGVVDLALLGGAAIAILTVGVVALLSPPNTWDVMQYHLPRVVHWIQNRSVAFYPTHELKQLHMPPGAEYLILQLHALWGGDQLDNLVQWFALLGSVIGVTALARVLGAGSLGQVLAAIVCATIPEGVLAASGAKNDYVLAFWLVALGYYAVSFGQDPGWRNSTGLGAALGLAWLTKGTAYVFAVPFLVTLFLFWPGRIKGVFLKRLPLVILLAVGLNAGHLTRNYSLYGSPLGPGAEGSSGEFKYTNDVISVPATVSNALRNAVLHVRSEHRAKNAVVEGWLGRVLPQVGADVNDRRTNYFSFMPFQLPEVEVREGFAGNPAHLALVMITLLVLLVTGYRLDERGVAVYALGLVLSYTAFCAVLKWQPLNARLHLPLFVLWSAATGAVLGNTLPPVVVRGLAIVLLLLAIPACTRNEARALIPHRGPGVLREDRSRLYFGDRRGVAADYLAAVDLVKKSGCRDVGLDLSAEVGAQYEYALLVFLAGGTETRFRALGVTNGSSAYGYREQDVKPCVVICVLCADLGRLWERFGGGGATAAVFGDIVVFTPGRDRR